MKELIKIQSELNAPKNQYNNFGRYAYRSCEDILQAVKPLLLEMKCYLTISDKIISIDSNNPIQRFETKDNKGNTVHNFFDGAKYYIEATATITNSEGKAVTSTAFARESEFQKGMSDAQKTGSASSYARKYALNGLFCIDDNKDADSTNDHGNGNNTQPQRTTSHPRQQTRPPQQQQRQPQQQPAKQQLPGDKYQEMLKNFASWKAYLNKLTGSDETYYNILGSEGFEKANQILGTDAVQKGNKILKLMSDQAAEIKKGA